MTATRGRTAAFTLALSLITGAITARQQPQPAPAPTPTIDLSGKWVTDEGFIVHIEQHGSSVNARFEQSHPCKSGGERTSLLVDARYGGSTLSGTRAYIACAFATPPFLRVCNLESVYGTKFEATVSADGSMISGQWLADGHWVTLSGDTPVGCRPDSTYDALTDFTLTRCGSIAINLTSPDNFKINTDPKMAEVKAASDPAQSGATWESKITFSRSAQTCSGGPDFNSTNVTGTGADFTPAFGALYGGDVKFVLKSACGDVTVNKEILGTDPGKPAIQAEIGTVGSPFDPDDLKRIACQESGQRQFLDSGRPNIGGTGDFGIMQICYQRTTRDLWDWKHNISRGRATLAEMLAFSGRMSDYWRVGMRVRNRKTGAVSIVYPRNSGPHPDVTDFTDEQLRMEAIKRYNAGTDLDKGYWEWDPLSATWVANPQGGVSAYADEVDGRSPTC